MSEYRLIALDIDGTIKLPNQGISKFTVEVIKKLQEHGINIVLATGKQYIGIKPIVNLLDLQGPQITSGGAEITDPILNKSLYREVIPINLAREVINVAEQIGTTVIVPSGGRIYTAKYNRDIQYMMTYEESFIHIEYNLEAAFINPPIHIQVIVYGDDERYADAEKMFRKRLGKRLMISKSSPYYLDFSHPKATKGKALSMVASIYQLKPSEIIAIGDGENDIPMMEFAGYSVAMLNGSDSVKKAANEVTDSCANDGVAVFLRKEFNQILG